MKTDHAQFAEWDAAYVVRSLSPDDRRLYEAHLDECRTCREAIAGLAPTLGLLSRVTGDRAEALLEPGETAGPDPSGRERVVARGRREARRGRAVAWAGGLAAAAVLAVLVAFGVATATAPATPPEEIVALQAVTDVPLTAKVELTEVAWGTRIQMTCHYPPSRDPYAADQEWPYVLVVTSTDGVTSELSSWRAGPGTTARLDAGTALDRAEIASIEVRAVQDGRVLLRGEVGGDPGE
ncbi:zf-HC2 domain-containing protein [Microbacterium sp. E-13]|uniref:zf-HC2 domain-containing protein n=1 Tax=Microbacterium sp. E-13 TaxID=3404048 RepID=UPI003CF53755